MGNIGPTGSLDNDGLLRALLQLRNTPDPDCCISPAEVIFGRPICDAFSFVSRHEKFNNPNIRPTWREAWTLKAHSRELPPLSAGARVFIQNQSGPHPNKWDKTGTVVEVEANDQYRVKVDGSGRVTLRNRRFLRKFVPPTTSFGEPQVPSLAVRAAPAAMPVAAGLPNATTLPLDRSPPTTTALDPSTAIGPPAMALQPPPEPALPPEPAPPPESAPPPGPAPRPGSAPPPGSVPPPGSPPPPV